MPGRDERPPQPVPCCIAVGSPALRLTSRTRSLDRSFAAATTCSPERGDALSPRRVVARPARRRRNDARARAHQGKGMWPAARPSAAHPPVPTTWRPTQERISKLQGECVATADNTKHAAANNAFSLGLKRRDVEILGARQDVSRQTKHKDARQKLLKQVCFVASQLRAALTQLRPCTQGASRLNAPVRSPHRWRKKGLSFESFKIRCARRCSRPCRGALKGEARGEGGWVLGRATFVRGQSRAVRRSATLCTPQRSSNSDGSWLRWNANTT